VSEGLLWLGFYQRYPDPDPRLKTPMIRRQRGGKLESVSWDEALITSPLV
jgi:anaerobic selenocysteine-containing dehydrogenase